MALANTSSQSSLTKLSNQLLIAMPELAGSGFANSVIFICDHSVEGAMGLVINAPLDIPVAEIFKQLAIEITSTSATDKVFSGGPVNVEHGFILHPKTVQRWESTIDISDQTSLTTSKDIMEDIAQGKGPEQSLIILGYAGWGPGQLEQEIMDNAWLTVPCDSDLLFKTPYYQQASLAAFRAGIDLSKMSPSAGHA